MFGNECSGIYPWVNLISLFEVSLKAEAMEKIVNIFTSAYAHKSIYFDEVSRRGHHFMAEYLSDGTSWINEHQISY